MAGILRDIQRPLAAALLVALAGFVFSLSPLGRALEESRGLATLFALRGERPPPAKVVIANIDPDSARELGLPAKLSSWPRSIHARLVDALHRQGVGAVAFDVYFAEARDPADDRLFADSLRRAGNAVLFEKLDHAAGSAPSRPGTAPAMEMLLPPLPMFARAAAMLAPFPLPKRPIRVNQVWLFKTSAGGCPTLPAAALQIQAGNSLKQLLAMVSDALPNLHPGAPGQQGDESRRHQAGTGSGFHINDLNARGMGRFPSENVQERYQGLRKLFLEHPDLAEALLARLAPDACGLSADQCGRLHALVDLLAGPDSMYVNFYGPPATIPTWSYADFLAGKVPEDVVRGAAVFVGTARQNWVEQKDGFYTVFSRPDGLDLSGVEIAATAFANLSEGSAIRPLSPVFVAVLFVLTGILYTWICRCNTPVMAGLWLLLCMGALFGAAHISFSQSNIWSPLLGPLVVQPSLVFLGALYWRYRRAGRERENIRRAMRYYLPDRAVKALSKDLSFISEGDRMVYSVCLMTDAQNFTTLSEQMDPRRLSALMKEYYQHLFTPVHDQDGVISDVIGDSMLALWPTTNPSPGQRLQACLAGLAIIRAVNSFNSSHREHNLPTRIGLHFGSLLMGNIGAASHFEYAPIGDTVNTTSRIEGLNKHLRTRILATEAVVAGLDQIMTRNVGCFLLPGKSQPLTIFEIAGSADVPPAGHYQELHSLFAEALHCFSRRQWQAACSLFQRCLKLDQDDGPSLFYQVLCQRYQDDPPAPPWRGVVQITLK